MLSLVLVAGSGKLAAAIAEQLVAKGARARNLPARSDQLLPFTAADLAEATALVLAADDDPGNVDLALSARKLGADIPLVVRLFDTALVTYLRETLDGLTVLSMAVVSAPIIADAAIDGMARRTKGAARGTSGAPMPRAPRRRARLDRVLVGALAGLAGLVIPGTIFFAYVLRLPWLTALYFVWSTITTVGYGDVSLKDASSLAKVVGMFLMFAGETLIAVLFAFITGWVVSRRLEVFLGRVRVRERNHIIVAGAGNVSVRVGSLLGERGYRVVVIERNGERRNVEALRALGHHVIVADATSDDVLELARVDRAAAVLALTNTDAVNLQIALLVRARTGIPVVARFSSPELSSHVAERGGAIAISTLGVAAAEFARAALATPAPRPKRPETD
jgi:voltage-gated potassium channel Kch